MRQAVSCQAHMPAQVPGLVEKRPNLVVGDIVYLRQVPASTHNCKVCRMRLHMSLKPLWVCINMYCLVSVNFLAHA